MKGGRRSDPTLQPDHPVVAEIREATCQLARHMDVRGLMNIQFAVKKEDGRPTVYVLEVNPRGSRTVPFVSKATGVPWATAAAKVMVGVTLAEQGITRDPIPSHVSVKEAVFPFAKFTGVDIVLGPEMKSTGEVMGVSDRFSIAFAKSQLAAGTFLPTSGKIFISVAARAKDHVVELARRLEKMGFVLLATRGTAEKLEAAGIGVQRLMKLSQGHPNVLDYILNGDLCLIMNTPSGKGAGPTRAAFARRPSRTAYPASPRSRPPTPRCWPWRPCGRKRSPCRPCRTGFR